MEKFNTFKGACAFVKIDPLITMFRHRGKARTLSHNKKIASLLSFVAGIVNVAGFLSVKKLTTNVTGHFAFFIDEVFQLNFTQSVVYFLYILAFFLGSFCSNLIVELTLLTNRRYVYIIPAILESLILFAVAIFGHNLIANYYHLIACTLLFAMGLQNSLVTRISNAVVRTTHLTGLFTDLGIEFSQLFFYKTETQRRKLTSTIRLRLKIITFFFLGGIFGGVFYSIYELHILFVPAILLVIGSLYDRAKFKLVSWRRRYATEI